MSALAAMLRLMQWPGLSRNIRLKPEEQLSVAFANNLREYTLNGRLKAIWWHTSNELAGQSGSNLAKIRYAIAKAMGTISGAPDYVFVGALGGLFIELKVGRNKQSSNQIDFQAWCEHHDVPYHVCYSVEDAEAVLRGSGLLIG